MMRRWIQGERIRVIDPKGEFGNKFTRIGGEWIKISPMNDTVINPFEIMNTKIIKNEDGNDNRNIIVTSKNLEFKNNVYPNVFSFKR